MQARERERGEFLRRLRGDPRFLARHAPALASALYRKLVNRITLALAPVHRGRKIWPDWLGERTLPSRSGRAGGWPQPLPAYPQAPPQSPRSAPRVSAAGSGESRPGGDPEDYLADNRWGFLLESLLAQRDDWSGNLARCRVWIETHTDLTERAWEPYSSCERMANLLVFLAAMPAALRSAAPAPLLDSFLGQSLHWVYRHLEYYGPTETNNHILNDARALLLCGSAIGHTAAVDAAVRILRRCLPDMITPAGFLRERSTHYQLVVLNWLLDAHKFLAARTGEHDPDARFVHGYVERMVAATAMLCDSAGGLLGLIGDVSPDATPGQSSARLRRLYPEVWPPTDRMAASARLSEDWFRLSAHTAVVLGNLPRGRYPTDFPTHGHCDATSFVWLLAGRDILVDPGRWRYTHDPVSQFQRSALAHNVPLVDGFAPLCESVLGRGNWCPLPYAGARLEAEESEAGIVLRHDGFARCTPVSSHCRQINLSATGLLVRDSFDGRGSVWLELCWQFAEDFLAFEPGALQVRGGWCQVRMSIQGVPGPPHVQPACGADPGGWISRAYGERAAAPAVRLGWQVELPSVVTTQFQVTVP